uniref:Putative phd finger found in protein n=1 Tax=Nyssomyia neivai TaxID=330878 RepID=A0A1L8DNH5_9DIPT
MCSASQVTYAMTQCGICQQVLSREEKDKVTCSVCKSMFHAKCLKLTPADFATATTPNPTWRCVSCTSKERRLSIGSSSSQGNTKPKSATMAAIESFRGIFETEVKNMKEFREEMMTSTRKTSESVEKALSLIESLQAENRSLRQKVDALECQLREQDRLNELNTIELLDVPPEIDGADGTSYGDAANMLSTALNVEVTEVDVVDCYVINMQKRQNDGPRKRGNIWVVKLGSRRMRDRVMESVRAGGREKGWRFPCETATSKSCVIRVRERLTAYTRGLYNEVKAVATTKGWRYVWIKHGRVHVRVRDGGRVSIVSSSSDLSKISQ